MKFLWSAAALAIALSTSQSNADVIRFVDNTASQNVSERVAIALNKQNGASIIYFELKEPTLVVFTFMAECFATGPDGAYLAAVIQVRKKGSEEFEDVSPTSNDKAFCSAGRKTGNDWVSAATSGGVKLPKGRHAVRVMAAPFNNVETGRIDDLSFKIER